MLNTRPGKYYLMSCLMLFVLSGVKAENPAPREHAAYKKVKKAKNTVHVTRQGMLFVKNYISKSSDNLAVIRERSTIPFNIIDSIFSHYGLPLELKYLAVIESELKTSAHSKVGAVGPWQLMPQTAKLLGLKITRRVDERKNYYKSTKAAARYLLDLHTEFKDWLLVIAAYNGGPGPVHSAMRRSGSKNFWVLQKLLPNESELHVKRFLATDYYFEGSAGINKLLKSGVKPMPVMQAAASVAKVTPVAPHKEMALVREPGTDTAKFSRLMKESASSLQQSGQLLKGTK
ncbi:MAG TPA: lytic transglycosylase domain-containing protein [Puia sp.]|nr:lytic transglycosylase domain-containing protein [Puia sp.]